MRESDECRLFHPSVLAIEKKKQRDAHKGEAEDEGDVELDDLGMTGIAATGLIE